MRAHSLSQEMQHRFLELNQHFRLPLFATTTRTICLGRHPGEPSDVHVAEYTTFELDEIIFGQIDEGSDQVLERRHLTKNTTPIRDDIRDAELFQPYLDPGECLYWTGAPVMGMHLKIGVLYSVLIGVPLTFIGGFVLLIGVAQLFEQESQLWGWLSFMFAWIVGVPFTTHSAFMVFAPFLSGPLAAKNIRYALTDRSACIISKTWPRTLKTYPLGPKTPIELVQRRQVSSVYFHTDTAYDQKGNVVTGREGFENVANGPAVYKLIRALQAEMK